MDAGYAPNWGHRSSDYAMIWLGRQAELGPLGVGRINLAASETYSRAGHYK